MTKIEDEAYKLLRDLAWESMEANKHPASIAQDNYIQVITARDIGKSEMQYDIAMAEALGISVGEWREMKYKEMENEDE